MNKLNALILIGLMLGGCSDVALAQGMDRYELEAHMRPYFEQVVDAIWIAEGREAAKKPFGILSVPCSDYSSCRKVCYNTVRNNYFRWIEVGRKGDYIDFLARKYAPVGVSNDPKGLNANWSRNVKTLLER